MKKFFVFIGICLSWFWKLINMSTTLVTNLFFLVALVFILSLFIQPKVTVPTGSALVLAPAGDLVEKKTMIDPISRFINGYAGVPLPEETLVQDVLDVINTAAGDDRIKCIVLQLDDLTAASLNQLQTIGHSLNYFRQKGKKVIAYGNHFPQGHYYLASFADEIHMNPMGSVNLWGFGVFRLYMKELIDRLAINFHVFKVGTFKSALEPFTRNDMSAEARAANQEWLSQIWNLFCEEISVNRNFAAGFISDFINNMPTFLEQASGNSGQMAVDNRFIDSLKTKPEMEQYLIGLVGESDATFRQISFQDYMSTLTPSYTTQITDDKGVAIIIARGNIVNGEIVPGQISSEGLGELIRQARDDSTIKAVVLRIDSGGGSAFAAEQIRQELLLLKKAGKPVVISMGSMAASGAYWLAAVADRIIASPFTLTGSIGIYGMLPTFENTIGKIGVSSDGIGTTKMAGAGDPTQALPQELATTIQLNVEEGYKKFLTIVAEGRDMDIDQVDKIAQGHVWDGATAQEIGLVDELGELEQSVQAAADLAGLNDFTPVYLHHTSTSDHGLLEYFSSFSMGTMTELRGFFYSNRKITRKIQNQFQLFIFQNDPGNIYAHSLIPDISF